MKFVLDVTFEGGNDACAEAKGFRFEFSIKFTK